MKYGFWLIRDTALLLLLSLLLLLLSLCLCLLSRNFNTQRLNGSFSHRLEEMNAK